jgi:MoxR-like ATPase
MASRHAVDLSARYRRRDAQPTSRHIEAAGVDPVPETVTAADLAQVSYEPYIASRELEEAVNVAIALGRPLLLQGDPGVGKTQLAHAVAYALGLPLETAYIKSTTRAQDLLYTFDAVRRLYDAQMPAQLREAGDYVRFGPLGRAILRAEAGRRSVVLIDEIDKADLDFPNDLLHELDQLAFDVVENGSHHAVPVQDHPELRPIIVVTNNEEKVLPSAFLRRCVFHHIAFPTDRDQLARILAEHAVGDEPLRKAAVDVLLRLRTLDLVKKPGVSELLDWVGYLHALQVAPERLGTAPPPYAGTLLKTGTDLALAATPVPSPVSASPASAPAQASGKLAP